MMILWVKRKEKLNTLVCQLQVPHIRTKPSDVVKKNYSFDNFTEKIFNLLCSALIKENVLRKILNIYSLF